MKSSNSKLPRLKGRGIPPKVSGTSSISAWRVARRRFFQSELFYSVRRTPAGVVSARTADDSHRFNSACSRVFRAAARVVGVTPSPSRCLGPSYGGPSPASVLAVEEYRKCAPSGRKSSGFGVCDQRRPFLPRLKTRVSSPCNSMNMRLSFVGPNEELGSTDWSTVVD
jgi:hypothetical protein